MGVQEDLREIKRFLEERETIGLMRLVERSLAEFMEREPDLYSLDDLKVRYGR